MYIYIYIYIHIYIYIYIYKRKNSLCTSKSKECCKVKKLIKNTPFKLHHTQQRRGVLRPPSNI